MLKVQYFLATYHATLGAGVLGILVYKGFLLPIFWNIDKGIKFSDFIIFPLLWSLPHVYISLKLIRNSRFALSLSILLQAFFAHLFLFHGFDLKTPYEPVLFLAYLLTGFYFLTTYSKNLHNDHSAISNINARILFFVVFYFIILFGNLPATIVTSAFSHPYLKFSFTTPYGLVFQIVFWSLLFGYIRRDIANKNLAKVYGENIVAGSLLTSITSLILILLDSLL